MEKKTSSANKLALKRILAQEGNTHCADCKVALHPRWASWNLGILICIRCSGIHRSLGTHISKVRSIDLDTWNDQQLEKLLELGNIKANAYWEAKLPPNYVPDESKIMNFIKTKYELKRWIPDDDDLPLAAKAPKLPPKIRDPPTSSMDLLDLDGAFNVKSKPTTAGIGPPPLTSVSSASTSTSTSTSNVGSRQKSTTSSASSALAPSASRGPSTYGQRPAGAHPPLSARTASSTSSSRSSSLADLTFTSSSQQQQQQSQNQRADVKKSILSLYSQPSPSASVPSSVPTSRPGSASSFARPNTTSSPFTMMPSAAQSSPQVGGTQAPLVPQTPSMSVPQRQATSAAAAAAPAAAAEEEDNFANVWN